LVSSERYGSGVLIVQVARRTGRTNTTHRDGMDIRRKPEMAIREQQYLEDL
jgi:hypothetical protein